jgi:hypothetical protein
VVQGYGTAVPSLAGGPLRGEVVPALSLYGAIAAVLYPQVRVARERQWALLCRDARRREHRERVQAARRRGPAPPPPVDLPVLAALQVPMDVPGGVQAAPLRGVLRMLARYRPDATLIDGTFKQIMEQAQAVADDHAARLVGLSTVFRGGVQLQVLTAFTCVDLATQGPPLLWSTRVFQRLPHNRRRGRFLALPYNWRYVSRAAASAGHQQVVAALRADRRWR